MQHIDATRTEHRQITLSVHAHANCSADPPGSTHHSKAYSELRRMSPRTPTGSQIRPGHVLERVALSCACDQQRTRGEVSVSTWFELVGQGWHGRLLGAWVQHMAQEAVGVCAKAGSFGWIARACTVRSGGVPSEAQSIPEYENGSDYFVAEFSPIIIEHEKSTQHLPNSRRHLPLGMSLGHVQIHMRLARTREEERGLWEHGPGISSQK